MPTEQVKDKLRILQYMIVMKKYKHIAIIDANVPSNWVGFKKSDRPCFEYVLEHSYKKD